MGQYFVKRIAVIHRGVIMRVVYVLSVAILMMARPVWAKPESAFDQDLACQLGSANAACNQAKASAMAAAPESSADGDDVIPIAGERDFSLARIGPARARASSSMAYAPTGAGKRNVAGAGGPVARAA